MPYLNLDLDYFDHPKTIRLVAICGDAAETAPIKLWCHAGKFCPESGLLKGYSVAEVEAFAKWRGGPGALVSGLVRVGLLHVTADGYQLHEWLDHEGHLVAFKERSKKANAARWESSKDPSRTPNEPRKESSLPSLPNQPSLTVPDQKKRAAVAAVPLSVPDDLLPSLPEITDWIEYKRQRGETYKAKGLEGLWKKIRKIPPDRRREAVDHSIGNNYAGLFQSNGGTNGSKSAGYAEARPGKYAD